MKIINFKTHIEKHSADLHTPVGIYLQMRDYFPSSVLLESTDFHSKEDSWSFIALQPIAGIEIKTSNLIEYKFPLAEPLTKKMAGKELVDFFEIFREQFCPNEISDVPCVQGLFGYTTYDMVADFQNIQLNNNLEKSENAVALMRYRFYQYVLAINHFNDVLYICENVVEGIPSEIEKIKTILLNKNFTTYPFKLEGEEKTNLTDNEYMELVEKAKQHCQRGDVFQLVLSRRFENKFNGDEFNVYRALRSINPSPYLFYFDYIDYKIFGSSPESQLIVQEKSIKIHPIAGTVLRSGNDVKDAQSVQQLLLDKKENAEHTMLVDLARNDLSMYAKNVHLNYLKEVKFYSHVIHLVSEVEGELENKVSLLDLLATTFPAGTVSGAPKHKALQLIDQYENTPRGIYAGAIGFIGFQQIINHAIIIRSFLSKKNTLYYQAGAGLVISSIKENEKQEVNNKLAALKKALQLAQQF